MSLANTQAFAGPLSSFPVSWRVWASRRPVGVPVRVTAPAHCGPLALRVHCSGFYRGGESMLDSLRLEGEEGCVCCGCRGLERTQPRAIHRPGGGLDLNTTTSSLDSEQGLRGLGLQGPVGPVCCSTLPCNCLFIPVSPLEVNSSGAELALSAPSC